MGAYRLVRKLATGGMAEVFLAKAVGLDGFERILPHLTRTPSSSASSCRRPSSPSRCSTPTWCRSSTSMVVSKLKRLA